MKIKSIILFGILPAIFLYYYFVSAAGPTPLNTILGGTGMSTTTQSNQGKNLYAETVTANGVVTFGYQTNGTGGSGGGGLATSTLGQYTPGNLFFVANSSTASASDNLRYVTSTGALSITATSTFTGKLSFGSASGTNISVSGYGTFPTLNSTNATLTSVSSTNITASGYGVFPTLVFTNASGSNQTLSGYLLVSGATTLGSVSSTNITASGYGLFPTLSFTNASGTNISGSGFVDFSTGRFTNVSSTNYSASGYGLFPTLSFTNSSGTNSSVSGYGLFPSLAYTNATGTNIFNTTASSTNLGFTNATGTRLSIGNVTSTGLTISGITGSTQCLKVDTNGLVSGSGADCGTGTHTGNGTSSNIAFFTNTTALSSNDNFKIVTSTLTLWLNSTGTANLFIGQNAGRAVVASGDGNTFIGGEAGASSTTGTANVFLGSYAGVNNTTGAENMFIGGSSGFSNTTGNGNTFIGSGAGASFVTDSNNLAIGSGAGAANSSGNKNIFIGNSVADSNMTGSNNIIFGHSSNIANTVSSSIIIGNGLMINASNTGVIGGSGFKLGIATESPSSTLHINGSLIFTSATGTSAIITTATTTNLHASSKLQIPTNQELTVAGQLSVKTTSSTLNFHDGTNELSINPIQCSNSAFTLANVTSTSSQYDFWHPVATSTITRLTARNGNASGTMDFNLIWHSNGATASSSQKHLFNGSGQLGNVTSSATTTLDIFPSLVSFASTTVSKNDVVQIITGPRASSTQWSFGICWKETL